MKLNIVTNKFLTSLVVTSLISNCTGYEIDPSHFKKFLSPSEELFILLKEMGELDVDPRRDDDASPMSSTHHKGACRDQLECLWVE